MSNDSINKESLERVESSKLQKDQGCTIYQKLWTRRYLIGFILAFSFWRNRYYSIKLEWPVSEALKKTKHLTRRQVYQASIKENI